MLNSEGKKLSRGLTLGQKFWLMVALAGAGSEAAAALNYQLNLFELQPKTAEAMFFGGGTALFIGLLGLGITEYRLRKSQTTNPQ